MKSNLTIEQAIESVTNSPSTIFHKDDVLRILSGIVAATMSSEQIDKIASEIANRIDGDRDDICSLESVTVSVNGYGNGIDDSSFNIDFDRISDIVLQVLTEYITPAEETGPGSENNAPDNQGVTN